MLPERLVADAEDRARKVREGADQYAAGVFIEMEARLSGALGTVRKGREVLEGKVQKAEQPVAEAAAKSKREAFDLQVAADETAALESV